MDDLGIPLFQETTLIHHLPKGSKIGYTPGMNDVTLTFQQNWRQSSRAWRSFRAMDGHNMFGNHQATYRSHHSFKQKVGDAPGQKKWFQCGLQGENDRFIISKSHLTIAMNHVIYIYIYIYITAINLWRVLYNQHKRNGSLAILSYFGQVG